MPGNTLFFFMYLCVGHGMGERIRISFRIYPESPKKDHLHVCDEKLCWSLKGSRRKVGSYPKEINEIE